MGKWVFAISTMSMACLIFKQIVQKKRYAGLVLIIKNAPKLAVALISASAIFLSSCNFIPTERATDFSSPLTAETRRASSSATSMVQTTQTSRESSLTSMTAASLVSSTTTSAETTVTTGPAVSTTASLSSSSVSTTSSSTSSTAKTSPASLTATKESTTAQTNPPPSTTKESTIQTSAERIQGVYFWPDSLSFELNPLSSLYIPEISDTDIVDRIWEIYLNFMIEKDASKPDDITQYYQMSFKQSATGESEISTLYENGVCQFGGKTGPYFLLQDGAKTYQEILRYAMPGETPDGSVAPKVEVTADAMSDVPDEVLDFAKDYVQQLVDDWNSGKAVANLDMRGRSRISAAKVSSLTLVSVQYADEYSAEQLWQMEFRLLPEDEKQLVLGSKMQTEQIDGKKWLKEWGVKGQPYLLLHYDRINDAPLWQRVAVTYTDEIETKYGTEEMLEKYGDALQAATEELYLSKSYLTLTPMRAEFATEEALELYASYEEFPLKPDEFAQRILLKNDTVIKDFAFVYLGFDDSNDGFRLVEDEVLCSLQQIRPDKPLVIWVSFPGSIPQYGIRFIDGLGKERHFFFEISGEDGSLRLVEY